MINYQGFLTDQNGTALNGSYNITFAIYADPTGAASIVWDETHTSINVEAGLFNVLLGSIDSLTVEDLKGDRYLGIRIAGEPEMTPRMRLASVAYSLQAENANIAQNAIHADSAQNANLLDNMDSNDFVAVTGGTMSGTLSLPALNATGNITSSKWKVYEVMNNVQGPLPKESVFTAYGGTLLILVSGSGYANWPSVGIIGINIKLDGAVIGSAFCYTNETTSHKSYVPKMIVVPNVSAASHTIRLEHYPGFNMNTDTGDFFNVTVIDFPF